MRKFLATRDAGADIPFNGLGFIKAISEYARTFPGTVSLVATVRDRDSWILSMSKSPDKGGPFIRKSYNLTNGNPGYADWGQMWDKHMEALRVLNISTLDMGSWEPLCRAMYVFNQSVQDACWNNSFERKVVRYNRSEFRMNSGSCNDTGGGSGY
jgi:hypothetical protein